MFLIIMSHSKHSTWQSSNHLVPIIQAIRLFCLLGSASRNCAFCKCTGTRGESRPRNQCHYQYSCWYGAGHPSPNTSSGAMIRTKGEGQVSKVSQPSLSRPQSRRLRPMLRLSEHFALTLAFVEAPGPQIANGSSSWPLRSRSAMTRLLGRVGGHGATKTTAVCCRALSRAG